MKKFITSAVLLATSLVLFIGCGDESNPVSSSSPVVGTWKNVTSDPETGMTMTSTMTFNANGTYEMKVLLATTLFAQLNGTWTATADSITGTPTSCKVLDITTGNLEATDECGDLETTPINISGNTWTINDEETGDSMIYTKQ